MSDFSVGDLITFTFPPSISAAEFPAYRVVTYRVVELVKARGVGGGSDILPRIIEVARVEQPGKNTGYWNSAGEWVE